LAEVTNTITLHTITTYIMMYYKVRSSDGGDDGVVVLVISG
jgi:hypothetical protein